MKLIPSKLKELPVIDRIYAGTIIPIWVTWTIYIIIGIPIGGFFGFL